MSWFAEFNPQIDWYNHSVSLALNAKQCTVIAVYAAYSFSGIDLYTANQFNQLLTNPKSSAIAFAVPISHVEASTSYSLIHVGIGHPSLLSWLFS